MTRQEQIAQQTYIRRTSANNGLPYRQQQQLYEQETDEYEDMWPPPTPRSAIRYATEPPAPVIVSGGRRYVLHANPPPPQTQRRSTPPQQVRRAAPPPDDEEEDEPPPRHRRHHRVHWSLIFGVGMVAMLALWILGNTALHWWQVTQDDWHYGRPRTFQIDMVVGHNDSATNPSHFVAMNYRSHVEIIEFPGGDVTKARLYQGPTLYGDSQDLTAVTLSFRDITGNGKLDMILSVGSVHVAFINDNGQFRLLKPGERVSQY